MFIDKRRDAISISRLLWNLAPSSRSSARKLHAVQLEFPARTRASRAELLSAFLLPPEIVRPKTVQVVKFDGVVVARRMQDHAVRRRARLFVADIGVAHEW
jgi:hypothetical protein